MPKREFLVTSSSGTNQRLDVFLSLKIREMTRSQVQKVIEGQRVKVNGAVKKSNYRLRTRDKVVIDYDVLKSECVDPENIPMEVLYQDGHVAVINKPSGMVVHPGAANKQGTLVNALLFHFPEVKEIGPEERPGIVHRLDKETSGLMVVARTLKSFFYLKRQFKKRQVEKFYLGLVWGKMSQKRGKITWPIGRHTKHGERISVKTKKPREAETRYTTLESIKDFTLLEIKPITGRTHQIRVHFAASGHPVVGDRRYGRRKGIARSSRLFLHASRLGFFHPESEKWMEFSSPLPEDLKKFLYSLKGDNPVL